MNPEAPVSSQKVWGGEERGRGSVSKVSWWVQALTTQPPKKLLETDWGGKDPIYNNKNNKLRTIKKNKNKQPETKHNNHKWDGSFGNFQ